MVDRADINAVLTQMRAMQAQAQQGVKPMQTAVADGGVTGAGGVDKSGFGDMLKQAVDSVNELQSDAKNLATSFEKGDPSVDLPQVMISMQKASVGFEAMTQVRNKLVAAYEDVMKMAI